MKDEGNPGGHSSPWETAALILPAAPCGVYWRWRDGKETPYGRRRRKDKHCTGLETKDQLLCGEVVRKGS